MHVTVAQPEAISVPGVIDEGGTDVVSAVRLHAATTPSRIALTWLDGFAEPVSTTYGELDEAATAVAASLLARAEAGDRVLLVQPPGLDFVTAFLGCLYAGCVPVPVYPLLDTDDNVANVRRVLADSGAAVAWTGDEAAADFVGRTLGVETLWAVGTERYRPDEAPDAGRLAFLQYTSGSTGDPRGVMVGHGNLAANLAAIRTAFRHDADSVVLSWLPAYHDMGLIGNILHPLHTGCRAYLASPLDFLRQPLRWLTAIARYGVTTSGAPNFAYDLVVRTAATEGLPELDLSTWRTAYCGAEPVSHRTLGRFADLLTPHGFRREAFVPCYGLAEATLLVTSTDVGEDLVVRSVPDAAPVVSCGTPRGCRVAVVDTTGAELACGEVGEILVQGPSVAGGYFNRQEAHAATFGATVTGRPGTWLRTGDLGFLDQGRLFVTGRVKDVMVVRGRNHHPQDVERLVTEICQAVRPGCVAAFASPSGEGVVVVAELRPGRRLTGDDRTALASATTSATGLALERVVAVPKGTIPKTTSGKLRRAECRARFLSGDYDEYEPELGAPAAPAGEDAIRAAVREVLGAVPRLDTPLVAHGLDSLRAVRLAELVLRGTGADIPVRTLLRGATVADLLAVAERSSSPVAAPSAAGDDRLSRAQESLLFLHMLNPASDEYTITFAWEPAPGTDLAVLDEAIRLALSWRPELATRIVSTERGWGRGSIGDRALRDALAMSPIPVPDGRLPEQLHAAAAMPFDLEAGPLFRLYRWQPPTGTVYQLVVHHVVTDLWSLCLVLRDVGTCYDALRGGRTPTPPAAQPYPDYVREQEEYLVSPAAAARDEEMRALLPTRAASVDIRTDRPRPVRRSARAGRVATLLAAPRVQDPVAALIVAWALTLHRYGTPSPVVVGVPVSGRTTGRHATVAGLCTNTVPVALDLDQDLAALVVGARDQLDRGMDAGFYPLARAVEVVRPDRVAGRHPLVETLITVQENPLPDVPGVLDALSGEAAELDLGPLWLRTVPVPGRTCRYDLDLVITPVAGGYRLALDYAADLFTLATAESLLATFHAAAAAALDPACAALDDLRVLSDRDQELLAAAGRCDTAALSPPPLDRIRRVAVTDPERPAVVAEAGVLTYERFSKRVDRVAAAVCAAAEPAAGWRQAALLLPSSPDFAVAMFGAWAADLGILPLPLDHPDGRLLAMLADGPTAVVLTSSAMADRAHVLAGDLPVLAVDELPEAGEPPANLPGPLPAFTVYTSGSTGTPKGVVIRQDQISSLVAWSEREWRLGPWARIAQTLSLGFDFGLQELFTILPTGGTVVVPAPADRRDARYYARFLHRERITVLFTTPSYADELAAAGEPLPELRLVLLGGEVLRRSTVDALRALVGPDCRIYNGYGPTEASVNCLMYEVPDGELPDVVPVGTATAASRIHLVDAEDRPVPVGAPGEILIGGPGVADGYLNRPELTAERFVRLDLDPGPVYRTGDLAHLRPDGVFVVAGRADRQVKLRGFRVEPAEVEHALLGAPGVTSAVVRVLGDPGELTAFLTGDRVDLDAVGEHLAGVLPPVMIPTVTVPVERLPTTPNGKLDEQALTDLAAQIGPSVLAGTASPAEVEDTVCQVWASALALSSVDSTANVFDLGAHSLIVTRVHSRLQATVGVTFPVHEIFENPRPRDLARRITAQRRAGTSVPSLSAANAKDEQ